MPIQLRTTLIICLFLSILIPVQGQWLGDYLGDESVLYAETKQVNQFFRRFNGEESPKGKRYYAQDRQYRDRKLRRKYLKILFDLDNQSVGPALREKFIDHVTLPDNPHYLEFHGGEWFAEVVTTFRFEGREQKVTLFLKLQEEEVGSKWVFFNVYFEPFRKLFEPRKGEENIKPAFIHPMSHELDFMNLIKVFRNGSSLEKYAARDFKPDYLTLFLYEVKKGNLSFETVNKVNFHFFQIEGWYFKLSEIQRRGPNRGWLISEMTEIPSGKKDLLLKFIYHD